MSEASAFERGMRSVRRGQWGERLAEAFLKRRGWRTIERNSRPCKDDARCEIDLVMSTPQGGVVFVEVKTHGRRTAWSNRFQGIDRRKKRVLLRACANWVMRQHWHGNFRFDVVEIWGSEDSPTPPEIDHIENVRLFGANWRFWRGGVAAT